MTRLVSLMALHVAAIMLWAAPAPAQVNEVDVAMRFFSAGGAYCFRIAPEGVSLSDETEWTVMLLAGTKNPQTAFRIRTVDPGKSGVQGTTLKTVGLAVTGVWRMDSQRSEFFERFAKAIRDKTVRARVVRIAPVALAEMPPRQRAEAYLKFSDRGERVLFGKSTDLSADEFLQFETYIPD